MFAIIDVEGNYFIVKAYNYTSLLSAMLLDSWTIPCVVILSVFVLRMRFLRLHYLGVVICLLGMGFLVWSDMVAGKNFPGSDYLKGDLFCIIGATFYALSNVGQEFLVRQRPIYEVVGQLGFWGAIVNGIQLAILERHELETITWTGEVVGYIIGFDIAMFMMYSVAPILLRLSSATFFNLSLLTSDFYGLLFGLFLFDSKVTFKRVSLVFCSIRFSRECNISETMIAHPFLFYLPIASKLLSVHFSRPLPHSSPAIHLQKPSPKT